MQHSATTLVYLLVLANVVPALSSIIGVCIGGQTARLQPTLLRPLFTSNTQDQFRLFYSLQTSHNDTDIKYWSDKSYVYEPTKYVSLDRDHIRSGVEEIYADLNNVKVVALETSTGHSAEEWSALQLSGQALSVIRLPKAVPEIVLNMYEHQNVCAAQMGRYMRDTSTALDFVFWAREDMHFYTRFDLAPLKSMLEPADAAAGHSNQTCQLISRGCLTHGGISLRGYLWKPEVALPIMNGRLDFYRHLHGRGESVVTVEAFEAALMQHHNVTVCPVSPDLLPTVAVRHTGNGSFCIPPMESSRNCYPTGMQNHVASMLCIRNAPSDSEYAARVRSIESPLALAAKNKAARGRSRGVAKSVVAGTVQAESAVPPQAQLSTPVTPGDTSPKVSAAPAATSSSASTSSAAAEITQLQERLKLSDLKVRSLEYKLKQMVAQKARQTSSENALLRKELVTTKKQVQDLDQRRSAAEAQLGNLRGAYERLSAEVSQCQAQLSVARAAAGSVAAPAHTAADGTAVASTAGDVGQEAPAAPVEIPAQQQVETEPSPSRTEIWEAAPGRGKSDKKGMWGSWF